MDTTPVVETAESLIQKAGFGDLLLDPTGRAFSYALWESRGRCHGGRTRQLLPAPAGEGAVPQVHLVVA